MADDAVRQLLDVRLLLVATEAPAHVHFHHRVHLGHVADVAVAALAVQAGDDDVHLMREVHKARQLVDAHPGDRLLALPIARQLLDLRRVRRNDFVAAHALLDAGDAGSRRSPRLGVAKQTRDAGLNHDFVVEGDWLLGRGLGSRCKEE